MSSMQLTPCEIVTEIVMSMESTPWLAVEGDSDERLLRSRSYPQPFKIVIGYGWNGVINILEEYGRAKAKAKAKLIGIIDRDYRDHLNCQISHDALILTDFRDIENMLFNSSALARVMAEYASINKTPKKSDGTIDINEIRGVIYKTSVAIGKFRIYCQSQDKNIDFKTMEHKKFICDKTLLIDESKFIAHLNGKNQGKNLSISDWQVAQRLHWENCNLGTPQFISNGHDIMAILCISLRRIWGSRGGNMTPEDIEPIFRIGYSDDELKSSVMWGSLEQLLSA